MTPQQEGFAVRALKTFAIWSSTTMLALPSMLSGVGLVPLLCATTILTAGVLVLYEVWPPAFAVAVAVVVALVALA